MSEPAIADLNDALLALESQLESLRTVDQQLKDDRIQLNEASEQLSRETDALRTSVETETTAQRVAWAELTANHAKATAEVVKSVETASKSTAVAAEKASKVATAVGPLARTISDVRFPERLDKIDLATSTLANTLASSQADIGRRYDMVQSEVRSHNEALDALRTDLRFERRRSRMLLALMLLNITLLVASLYFQFRP